ncbi:GNAT family N-acetyltransferase [Mariprofundus ferrooxydans]|uniref:GNAT family N-acetyltransferase n=1 Tax=Mariprofundus ferrooxydans TaxID=314344 RepID=UPI00037A48E8|nr:GNAT family N-acetyltransferase [Mariprofundus ferrooxydans]
MNNIQPTPWDSAAFGIDCFEITRPDDATLCKASETTGHYTVKIDPLADKQLLHEYGFYYTDTLIEPACTRENWLPQPDLSASADRDITLEELLPMCDHSFLHGRFHRDFNLAPMLADARYKQWLGQLHQAGNVFALRHSGELAGFIAADNGNLLLHTIAPSHRGRGLARGLWTAVISDIFHAGVTTVRSSISAANMPVLNLYASLGFRFEHPVDIYHKLTR